jgi:hypothetical protein
LFGARGEIRTHHKAEFGSAASSNWATRAEQGKSKKLKVKKLFITVLFFLFTFTFLLDFGAGGGIRTPTI